MGNGWIARAAMGLGLGLLVAGTGSAGSRDLDAEQMLRRLQGWLDGTRDLSAEFRQTMESGALGSALDESGRVFLARPGRMRWDYLSPEYKVALVDGERTRLYVEEDRQLWEGRLDDSGAVLPLLLAGGRPLAELFEAELPGDSAESSRGGYGLRLTPVEGGAAFEEVVLRLRRSDFAIESAEVLDGSGNRMHYRFREMKRNRGVPATTFHFEPPPGTEIVTRP